MADVKRLRAREKRETAANKLSKRLCDAQTEVSITLQLSTCSGPECGLSNVITINK